MLTSGPSRKRMKTDSSPSPEDSDDEWTESEGSTSSKYSDPLPHDTSQWKDHNLRKVHIRWDEKMTSSPSELLDLVIDVPPLTVELEQLLEYIEEKIDIDISFDDIVQFRGISQSKEVFEKFSELRRNLRKLNTGSSIRELAVHVHGMEFLASLKRLIRSFAFKEKSYEGLFVIVLETFCKMCGLYGSHDIVKRTCKIQGNEVVSVPDLVFEDAKIIFEKGIRVKTLCVAEVKKKHYDHGTVCKERRTRSSKYSSKADGPRSTDSGIGVGSSGETEKTYEETGNTVKTPLLPFEIKGSSRHAAQLLLETKYSQFNDSIGIMFMGTKVIMTCLRLTPIYLINIEEKLDKTDAGTIHFTNMYDILKAEERKELVKALLRLSQCQDE